MKFISNQSAYHKQFINCTWRKTDVFLQYHSTTSSSLSSPVAHRHHPHPQLMCSFCLTKGKRYFIEDTCTMETNNIRSEMTGLFAIGLLNYHDSCLQDAATNGDDTAPLVGGRGLHKWVINASSSKQIYIPRSNVLETDISAILAIWKNAIISSEII